jgi:ankyrin repeat protein
MIARGADPGAVDGTGLTPLHVAAAENPSAAVAGALLAGGAPADARDGLGRTALHLAASPGVAALLVLAGADPCLTDGVGRPALSAETLAAIAEAAPGAPYEAAAAAFLSCL